jgi:uncharacterized peroxidase-related enzyme
MRALTSLPESPDLADVFRAFPYTVPPLLVYHDYLLRHDRSPFSVAERELIAAYVSGLNRCDFCYGSHKIIASTFGIEEQVVEGLLVDPATSGVEERLLPVLEYVRVLNESPSRVTDRHRQAILDAGWPEQAVFDAASICGLFNLMNRIVEGMGVKTSAAIQQAQRARHQRSATAQPDPDTYQRYGRRIGILE